MRKGDITEGYVTKVQFTNKGTVVIMEQDQDGNTTERQCIVKNVIPGQRVRIQIQKARKGTAEGRLLEVIQPAPFEIASPCPHSHLCGGCSYQTVPYEEQLKLKEQQVRELLWNVIRDSDCVESYRWEGIKGSPIRDGYRNKMEFTFGDEYKDGPLALGMHKRGSFYDLVTVSDCRIMDEDYRAIVTATRDFWAAEPVTYYHRMRHVGYLRHLLVRKAGKTGEILVVLVTSSQVDAEYEKEALDRYTQLLSGLHYLKGRIVGILHTVNDSVADVVKSDRTDVLYGQDFFYEELLGLRFKISAFSFFQNNTRGAEILYETAREYLGQVRGEGILYDLYSGTGTITQMMAPVVKKAIGVEIVEEAVTAARENAELNGLHNCEFIANDVMRALDDIEEKPDYIILDPPRDGIHPKALKQILSYGVDKIVYISCKPTSLARDLETVLASGYAVERAVAIDMFPGTSHVETVVLLSKGVVDKDNF